MEQCRPPSRWVRHTPVDGFPAQAGRLIESPSARAKSEVRVFGNQKSGRKIPDGLETRDWRWLRVPDFRCIFGVGGKSTTRPACSTPATPEISNSPSTLHPAAQGVRNFSKFHSTIQCCTARSRAQTISSFFCRLRTGTSPESSHTLAGIWLKLATLFAAPFV